MSIREGEPLPYGNNDTIHGRAGVYLPPDKVYNGSSWAPTPTTRFVDIIKFGGVPIIDRDTSPILF